MRQPGDILVGRRGQLGEAQRLFRAGNEESLGLEQMGMRRELKRGSEPLVEKDGGRLAVSHSQVAATAALPTKEGAHEAVEHLGQEGVVPGEVEAQWVGEREHPLTVRGHW